MGEVYKRPGSPFWYADLVAPDGQRIRRSTKQRVKDEARKVVAAWETEIRAAARAPAAGLPFSQAAIHFIEDGDLDDSSKPGYVSMVNTVVRSSLGDFDLATLTHDDLKALINERRKQHVVPHNKPEAQGKRRISDEHLRRTLSTISSVYRHAISHDLFRGANPVATFDRSILKKKKPVDRHLREREVEAVMATLRIEPRCIVVTLVLTGMRSGELRNLRWNQVDLKKKLIDLESGQTKTKRSRLIPFDDTVKDTLKTQKEALTKTGDYHPEGLVFPSPLRDKDGKRTRVRYDLAGILKTVKQHPKLKGYTNHRLRHTFASWLLQRDMDPLTIRDLLGHATLSTTTIYARQLTDSVTRKVRQTALPKLK